MADAVSAVADAGNPVGSHADRRDDGGVGMSGHRYCAVELRAVQLGLEAMRRTGEIERANRIFLQGMQLLRDQVRMLEVPKRGDRFEALAIWYRRDWRNSLIVTPDNQSIEEITTKVREKLQELGYLAADKYKGVVYRSAGDTTQEDLTYAANYRPGMLIRWTGKENTLGGVRDSCGGVVRLKSGQYTEIVSADIGLDTNGNQKNLLTIRVTDGFGDRTVTFDPRLTRELDESAVRPFAIGDQVQITRGWKAGGKQIPNREVGTIMSLTEQGVGEIDFDGRRLAVDMKEWRHIDHAYAMTSHSAQSITVPRVAVHIDVGDTRIRDSCRRI